MGCSSCQKKKEATIALQNNIIDFIEKIKRSRNVKKLNTIKKEPDNGKKEK